MRDTLFKKTHYRLKVIRSLMPFAHGVKRFFVINIFVSLAVMAVSFVTPIFYRLFINQVILNRSFSHMTAVVVGYLGLFVAGVGLAYLKNYCNNRLLNRTLFQAKLKIWKGFFDLPLSDIESKSIGDMKMRLEDDTVYIADFGGVQTIDYMIAFLTMLVSAGLLFFIDWRLWAFSITSIPFTFWIDHVLSNRERVLNASNRENNQKLSSWLHASVQGWREIKALNLQKHQSIRFVGFLHNFALYFGTWINYWVARHIIIPKIKDEFFMQFGLYFLGGLLIIDGRLMIGDLLMFALYYNILSQAVKTVSGTDAELQANMTHTDRLLEELRRKTSEEGKKVTPSGAEHIIFEQVSFAYPNAQRDVINNLNLRINKGERVAITGKSGSGKTTILKLMTGILTPTSGRVIFSGVDLQNANLSSIQSRIGFVMQENTLFNTTIRENLLYGKQNATDSELLEACRKAYIYDYVKDLPNGLDEVIGERGIKLSGGQRQRIILARLFLRDVDIFIFDEATSALDQYSESIVHDAIRSISKGKTIIVVSHRESSLELCERQLVIDTAI